MARNEYEVRTLLDWVWSKPKEVESIIAEAIRRKGDIYEFERQLGISARTTVELPSRREQF